MAQKKKSQKERFIEKAKELGVSENAEDFERAFKKIVPARKPKPNSASSIPGPTGIGPQTE